MTELMANGKRIIDAYAHCSPGKYLPIEELEAASVAAGVHGTLLVQHEGEFDNRYLASIVARSPERYRAVGLIDTRCDTAPRDLEGLLDGSTLGVSLVGVRMTRPMLNQAPGCLDVLNQYRGTLVVHLPDGIDRHVEWMENLVRDYPEIAIYVPHLGWPVVDGRATPGWHVAMERLSRIERVVCGLSAIHHFSREVWPHDDVWPYVRHVIATMGTERTVWASDFPLLLEQETLDAYLPLFTETRLGVDARGRAAILAANACRCWGFA